MVNRRVLIGGAGALLAQAFMQAQTGGRKIVLERDLPNVNLNNWSVTAVEISYGPGESSGAHRHPGITIAHVLEGEIRSKVDDEPARVYKTGEMFTETPNQLHGVSENASATKPAKLLAILLAEKGKQLTAPA